jgi:catechol 2,3-dioxygenase
VGSVDEIAMGAVRMAERGWQPGWGLGRHVIGSNFFFYLRDPWGSFSEYYFDLDYIPEACAWEPRDFQQSSEAFAEWAVVGGIDGKSRRAKTAP